MATTPRGWLDHDLVDSPSYILQVVALHQRRNSAGGLHVFNSTA